MLKQKQNKERIKNLRLTFVNVYKIYTGKIKERKKNLLFNLLCILSIYQWYILNKNSAS